MGQERNGRWRMQSLRLVACSISFPRQLSCMIPLGDGSPFL
jgi:hypothetical protein